MQFSSARQGLETRLELGEAWQSQAVCKMELTRSSLAEAGEYQAGGPLPVILQTGSDLLMEMDK